jgi:hypothetical protein
MGKKPLVGIIGLVWAGIALTGCDCCNNKDKSVQKPPYSAPPAFNVFNKNNTTPSSTPTGTQPGATTRLPGGPTQSGDGGVKAPAPDNLPVERISAGFNRSDVPPSGPGSQVGSPAPLRTFDRDGRPTGARPLPNSGAPTALPGGDPVSRPASVLPPPPVGMRPSGFDQAATVGAAGTPAGQPSMGGQPLPTIAPPPPPPPGPAPAFNDVREVPGTPPH